MTVAGAGGNVPPPTLDFLAFRWGDAYEIGYGHDQRLAARRDHYAILIADIHQRRIAVRTPPCAGSQGHSRAGDWPLQSFLELGALPGAVPCARLHARHVVREWGLAALGDSTELAVSELMTNAVQVSHAMSQAAPVRLWLLSDGAQLVILVWDASLQPPVRLDVGDAAEDGRGLLLVDAVSTDWGWQFPPDMGGKTVWALLG